MSCLLQKKCHACDQPVHDNKHDELLSETKSNLTEVELYYNQVSNDYVKVADQFSKIIIGSKPSTFYSSIDKALTHQNNLQTLENQLVSKAAEIDPYQDQIDDLKNTLADLHSQLDGLR